MKNFGWWARSSVVMFSLLAGQKVVLGQLTVSVCNNGPYPTVRLQFANGTCDVAQYAGPRSSMTVAAGATVSLGTIYSAYYSGQAASVEDFSANIPSGEPCSGNSFENGTGPCTLRANLGQWWSLLGRHKQNSAI